MNRRDQNIKQIRNDFPKGKIKKIYELSSEYLIIKFKPNETLKYLSYFDKKYTKNYYYCLAYIWGIGNCRFLPPANYTTIIKLLKETLKTDIDLDA